MRIPETVPLKDYSNSVVRDYQRKLLNIVLLVLLGPLGIIMVKDLYDWLFSLPALWGMANFLSDAVFLIGLVSAIALNRRGYNRLVGWWFTGLIFLGILSIYSPQTFAQAVLIMTFPIVLTSFTVSPLAAFLVAGLSLAFYTHEYFVTGSGLVFDLFVAMSLVLVALVSYLIASILNRTLRELVSTYDETIQAWTVALEMRDSETMGHSKRVVALTLRLAAELGLKGEAITHLHRGVLLHDFGKLVIPDAILTKPGPLDEAEWKIMRLHPEYAYQVFSKIRYLAPSLDIPRYHHEKWDGSGYPMGLAGEQIPFPARIFAIVDVWDALVTARRYREPWSPEKTLQFIQEQSGKHFDPKVVTAFSKIVTEVIVQPPSAP